MRTPEPRDSVAAEVRASMARAKATNADIADHLGISTATVSNKINGKTSFTVEEIVGIADFLGVRPGAILSVLDGAA